MLKFQYRYFIFAVILFAIEVYIALFVHDEIIRPHIGDLLVVILIYCFLRAFFNLPVLTIAIATLLFSCIIEALQYFNTVQIFGLQNSKLATTVMGTSFSWIDILCYTIGIIIVLLIEKIFNSNRFRGTSKPGWNCCIYFAATTFFMLQLIGRINYLQIYNCLDTFTVSNWNSLP